MGEEDLKERLNKLEHTLNGDGVSTGLVSAFVEFRAEMRTGLFLLKWMTGIVLSALMLILTYLGYNEARRAKNTALFSSDPSFNLSYIKEK